MVSDRDIPVWVSLLHISFDGVGIVNYKEALDYLHGTLKFGIKPGLENINSLLRLMGDPHRKLKYVHIAGTNGKGSTAAFISSILIESGYRVGIFTSPSLQRFTERIKINGKEISEDELAGLTGFVRENVSRLIGKGGAHPTEFEIVTAIAFEYFFRNECDIVVLEAGLGGRFDSTNVIDSPEVSVITNIGYDHMNILGDTLEKIAFEKAGIIKQNGHVVLYPQIKEVEEVFDSVCHKMDAVLYKPEFGALDMINSGIEGQTFNWRQYKSIKISMLGDHQTSNAVIAIEAAEVLKRKGFECITDKSIFEGLKNARWPGRFEIVKKDPVFIIDGAHNAQGAYVLSNNLVKYFPDKKKIFIVGVLRDKDYVSVLKPVIPLADSFIAVTPHSDRAMPAGDLEMFLRPYCKNVTIGDTIMDAVERAVSMASGDSVICAFGSLYYVGEIRNIFGL